MPNRKLEKRRRKLRVHGPSRDAVGAPPTGRKEPRPGGAKATPARGQRARREPAIPSLKRSGRKAAFAGIFMVALLVVPAFKDGPLRIALAVAEGLAFTTVFLFFDLWFARWIYKRVTGNEPPRETPKADPA
ncbi:MAG TPA: hypothetical protein VGK92_14455 [Gaiellales bacterium]